MAKTKKSQKQETARRRLQSSGYGYLGIALLATIILLVVKLLAVAKIYTLPNALGV